MPLKNISCLYPPTYFHGKFANSLLCVFRSFVLFCVMMSNIEADEGENENWEDIVGTQRTIIIILFTFHFRRKSVDKLQNAKTFLLQQSENLKEKEEKVVNWLAYELIFIYHQRFCGWEWGEVRCRRRNAWVLGPPKCAQNIVAISQKYPWAFESINCDLGSSPELYYVSPSLNYYQLKLHRIWVYLWVLRDP